MSSAASNPLPRLIDLRKFTQQGLSLAGDIAVSDMSRLNEVALPGSGDVKVALEFSIDGERHRLVTGEATCRLKRACQRCLEPVDVQLQAQLNLAIVWDEERAKQLPRSLDPLILGEGPADLYEIIEDELLLSLPMVSYHDEDCIEQTSFGEGEEEDVARTDNPFQVLEQLKGSPKS